MGPKMRRGLRREQARALRGRRKILVRRRNVKKRTVEAPHAKRGVCLSSYLLAQAGRRSLQNVPINYGRCDVKRMISAKSIPCINMTIPLPSVRTEYPPCPRRLGHPPFRQGGLMRSDNSRTQIAAASFFIPQASLTMCLPVQCTDRASPLQWVKEGSSRETMVGFP